MSKPVVSIISVSYNQEKYIRQALDSFLEQDTDFKYEVVIADDASTDSTPSIIQEYADKYPDIIKPILRKKNIGVASNFAETLKTATGKYIALCEGDDFWTDPRKLQMQVNFLNKHKNYSICFHLIRVFFENNEQKESTWPNISASSKFNTNNLLKENFIPTNSVMYRRTSYEELPVMIMPVDWYLHLYHARLGKIGFINKTMSSYRCHQDGVWWDSHSDKNRLWQKHGLSYLTMHVELLKLYGKDESKRRIIYRNLVPAIGNLVSVDEKYSDRLLTRALGRFPEIIEPLITNQQQVIQEYTHRGDQEKKEIIRLNQAIIGLRAEIFKQRDELHDLKNARLLGRIIKFRKYLGELLKRSEDFLRTTLGRVKRLVIKLLPRFIKVIIVRALFRRAPIEPRNEIIANGEVERGLPLVSVVIPFFNLASTIDDTLDSLDIQTFRNFETIIVDDGSTDPESVKKLKQIKAARRNVKVVHQKNQGVATARNTGIKLARGRYIICLDSDDMLDTTFIEKCTMVLETNPNVSLVTTQMKIFGITEEPFKHNIYNPLDLYSNNMVITAAEFSKKAWEVSGGYKSKIGYEDWEYWLNLAERGFWGKLLPEPLFKYRVAMESRYVDDKAVHWDNIKALRALHPGYKKKIKQLALERKGLTSFVEPSTAFVNMNKSNLFQQHNNNKSNILITIPWMTFGGAETLIYNYCREIMDKFNITFVTGLSSGHEWEYKFREITSEIYHMASIFQDHELYIRFLSNYIETRNIDILHIIHNGFTFYMLDELKRRHPKLKVVVTLFNDRVEYFEQSIKASRDIDVFVSDNEKVAKHFRAELGDSKNAVVIPNGINCYDEFNPKLFDRNQQRKDLGLSGDDLAVFFVGRLSEEKNPDVFLEAAKKVVHDHARRKIMFFVIGDGPKRPDIEKLVRKIGSRHITYLGYQSEVARYLSAADIFVLPSSIEGFPLSILEAMAMNVVVVASDVGAVGDVITTGKDGYVVPVASVDDIVGCIEMLDDNRLLLNTVKTAARQKVEKHYSNRILGSNYSKFYDELLS